MPQPNWIKFEKSQLSDGKFSELWTKIKFPGYIENDDHPFTHCDSLTYVIDGVVSDRWSGNDSLKLFTKNLKQAPKDWRYRTQHVIYKVNSSGYRTREWRDIDWKNAIVILGCSNTFGIGLDESETISSVLEKLTGRQVINLGYPAGSNDLILQNSSTLFERFGIPYAVIINWTTTDRFRYFTRENPMDLGPWNDRSIVNNDVDVFKLFQLLTYDEYNLQMRNYHISRAVYSTWHNRTKYITFSYFNLSAHFMRADAWFTIDNGARDMVHPGYENSKEVANFIFDRLK